MDSRPRSKTPPGLGFPVPPSFGPKPPTPRVRPRVVNVHLPVPCHLECAVACGVASHGHDWVNRVTIEILD